MSRDVANHHFGRLEVEYERHDIRVAEVFEGRYVEGDEEGS